MDTRWWVVALVASVAWGLGGAGCKDEGTKEPAPEPAAASASKPKAGPKVVDVGDRGVRPQVIRDGVPGRVVDMRVRANAIMDGVKPGPDGWAAGGDWRVFEMPYRDGGLKAELAIRTPKAPAGEPVAGRGRLRWLEGDAAPFLKALRFVLGAKGQAPAGERGKPVEFDLQVLTTSGKDKGTADFEPTGGTWIICRATAPGSDAPNFDLRFFPARELLRITPLKDQPVEPVLALFSSALK